jgi:hypothetical protein
MNVTWRRLCSECRYPGGRLFSAFRHFARELFPHENSWPDTLARVKDWLKVKHRVRRPEDWLRLRPMNVVALLNKAVEAKQGSPERDGFAASVSKEPDGFLDFTKRQRELLTLLRGKGKVNISLIVQKLHYRSVEALLKLKDRTNAALSTKRPNIEIRKIAETLSLQPI